MKMTDPTKFAPFALLISFILLPIIVFADLRHSFEMEEHSEWIKNISNQMKVRVEIKKSTILHVWMRAAKKQNSEPSIATLYLNGRPLQHSEVTDWFEFSELRPSELAFGGQNTKETVELSWFKAKTEITYIYVFEPETVKEAGIRPAFVRNEVRYNPALARESFHLRTPLGWANEPNGFTRTNDGLYHVFYQHIPNLSLFINNKLTNPKSIEAMHWGHVVSKDLVNWVHQPVFLRPKYEGKTEQDVAVSNWLSGSAVPMGKHGLRIFATNLRKAPNGIASSQMEVQTDDGILPKMAEAKAVVSEFPKGPMFGGRKLKLGAFNFRDPMVFRGPGAFWYMTIGTEDDSGDAGLGGAILLYRSRESDNSFGEGEKAYGKALDSGWEYKSVLLTDNRDGYGNIECPGMFPLGDPANPSTRYALIYARELGHVNNLHRQRDTLIMLGTFDGEKFEKISEQTVDFAFGSYGYQGFYERKSGDAILMGWMAWWNEWNMATPFYSSQTLPRLVKIAKDQQTLLVGPHPNVLKMLRTKKPLRLTKNAKGEMAFKLRGHGGFYVRLELDWAKCGHKGAMKLCQNDGNVSLAIRHPLYKKLGIAVAAKRGLELVKEIKKVEGVVDEREFVAKNAHPDFVHIFMDLDSMEVFGELKEDGGMGRWFGGTRLTGHGAAKASELVLAHSKLVKQIQVWPMKAAQMRGYFEAKKENGRMEMWGKRKERQFENEGRKWGKNAKIN